MLILTPILVFCGLVGTRVLATYNVVTVTAVDTVNADGSFHITANCTGDAGEPAIPLEVNVRGGLSTLLELRTFAWTMCDAVQRNRALATQITVGMNVPRPPAPAASTACQTFQQDLAKWLRVNAAIQAGILAGTETEIVALKNQVKGEYAAACLASF